MFLDLHFLTEALDGVGFNPFLKRHLSAQDLDHRREPEFMVIGKFFGGRSRCRSKLHFARSAEALLQVTPIEGIRCLLWIFRHQVCELWDAGRFVTVREFKDDGYISR